MFGGSYAARLGRSDRRYVWPDMRYFGCGGIKVAHVPNDGWRKLVLYSPDNAVLHMVGNDSTVERGGAMMPGKLPVPGRPTICMTVRHGPTALAVGAGGGCLDIFTLLYLFFPLPPSLWETVRYRLKYCLKGPLNPKPTTPPTTTIDGGVRSPDCGIQYPS